MVKRLLSRALQMKRKERLRRCLCVIDLEIALYVSYVDTCLFSFTWFYHLLLVFLFGIFSVSNFFFFLKCSLAQIYSLSILASGLGFI